MKQLSRSGSRNGNWKGGISLIKTADAALSLPLSVRTRIKREILSQYVIDKLTGCWNWTGGTFPSGRPCFRIGDCILAYRLLYALLYGPIGKLYLLHSCDNVKCINPKHLRKGTAKDNTADMIIRGRAAIGSKNGSRKYPERLVRGDAHPNHINPDRVQGKNNPRAVLTEAQIREIRRRFKPSKGYGYASNAKELAEEFGVSSTNILFIGKGLTWAHLK